MALYSMILPFVRIGSFYGNSCYVCDPVTRPVKGMRVGVTGLVGVKSACGTRRFRG